MRYGVTFVFLAMALFAGRQFFAGRFGLSGAGAGCFRQTARWDVRALVMDFACTLFATHDFRLASRADHESRAVL